MPGTRDTDIYHNFNAQVLYFGDNKEVTIKQGQPFAQFVPFKRSKIDLDVRYQTLEDEKLLNKNGLYHNNNCYLIDLNKDDIFIQNEINYIMNINNRNEINKIRLNGQQFAKNNLNSEKKFNEFIKIINNIYD